jgi:hypothetical protein
MTGKLITLAAAGAVALSISAAAQSGATRPDAGSTTTPPQRQTTPSPPEPGGTAQVPRAGDNVTFTGCVRQASDQATLFALFSTPAAAGRPTPGTSSGSSAQPTDRSTGADQSRGTAGDPSGSATAARDHTQPPSDSRTTQTAASPMAGSWYRLTPASNVEDLKEFVGKTVRVTGVYTPSTRGSTGTENHSMTQFTAGDVSNAPVIAIQSVTPVAMTCTGTTH